MFATIGSQNEIVREFSPGIEKLGVPNLNVTYERRAGILWYMISESATPHFSTELLSDIRSVQSWIRDNQVRHNGSEERLKYVVFGSDNPKTFSLGGDLRLFRRLIKAGDRAGIAKYAKLATDAVFYHSCNFGDAISISLVRGSAMGGGFEAALAGNVIVAEKGTKCGFPEVLFGLFPGMGAYTLLRRRTDAATAERMILSAKNYTAEELHEMGIIDILCEPGEGVDAVRSYISRQACRSGVTAFRRALNHVRELDREELYSISDAWVDAAMSVSESDLKKIDRLVANQERHFPSPQPPYQVESLAAAI